MSSGETIEITLTDPQAAILNSNADRNLLMMGQGGGKTNTMGNLSYLLSQNVPDVMGLIAANTYRQLTNSTLKEIFKQWASLGFTKYTEANPSGSYVIDRTPPKTFTPHKYIFRDNDSKIYCKNGAVIVVASLDNYMALEGMELGWALLDETEATKEEAVTEVITARLREKGLYKSDGDYPFSHTGTVPVNPLFVFTKPGRVDWLNNYFGIDKYRDEIMLKIFSHTDFFQGGENGRFMVIANAFHNKENLPDNYLENRLLDLTPDEAERPALIAEAVKLNRFDAKAMLTNQVNNSQLTQLTNANDLFKVQKPFLEVQPDLTNQSTRETIAASQARTRNAARELELKAQEIRTKEADAKAERERKANGGDIPYEQRPVNIANKILTEQKNKVRTLEQAAENANLGKSTFSTMDDVDAAFKKKQPWLYVLFQL